MAKLSSRSDVYGDDFKGVLRTPDFEFESVLHFHDFYEIQIILSGRGRMIVGDNSYVVNPGKIIFINMFEKHQFIPDVGCSYQRFCMNLDPSFLISACTGQSNLLLLFDRSSHAFPLFYLSEDQLNNYRNIALNYAQKELSYGQDIYDRSKMYLLLAYLYNDIHHTALSSDTATSLTVMIELLRYIKEHLSEEISLTELSNITFYNKSYLCRIFKQYTGTTLKKYINLKRIELCQQLMHNHVSPTEAYAQAGFNNYNYFFRTFKSIVGMSPKEYVSSIS